MSHLSNIPPTDGSYRVLAWLLSATGAIAILIAAPLLLIPMGAGANFLLVSLTIGTKAASEYDPGLYWAPAVLTSLFALVAAIRRTILIFRASKLTSVTAAAEEIFKRFFTLYLAAQISTGFVFATLGVIVHEGVPAMPPTDLLVVSLFSVFVFIVSTTFTSFFMRELIPWRKEHPGFSNSIAYTLSTLLGLIAGTYAFAEKTTFVDAGQVGATLYRASVAFATIGATAVGAYVALIKNKKPPDENGGPTPGLS
jgi:hypothetical protein